LAWKVIKENEVEKQKRLVEKEADKIHTQKITDEYNKMLDIEEKKRAD
jgi:hypothetical protein